MAVEPLPDLQSEEAQRFRGGAGAGTVGADDQHRWSLPAAERDMFVGIHLRHAV
jgi:hypothetical protein